MYVTCNYRCVIYAVFISMTKLQFLHQICAHVQFCFIVLLIVLPLCDCWQSVFTSPTCALSY